MLYSPTYETIARDLDAEIDRLIGGCVYGREHAAEVGCALIALFERRTALVVARHGDGAYIPRSACRALDAGNAMLSGRAW